MRTEDELKQIALDIFHKRIFHNEMIENPEDVPSVFMVLALMTPEQIDEMDKEKPALIFEYLDKAGPRSINGMPVFFSFQQLSQEEFPIVKETMDKLIKAVDNVLTEENPDEHSGLLDQQA